MEPLSSLKLLTARQRPVTNRHISLMIMDEVLEDAMQKISYRKRSTRKHLIVESVESDAPSPKRSDSIKLNVLTSDSSNVCNTVETNDDSRRAIFQEMVNEDTQTSFIDEEVVFVESSSATSFQDNSCQTELENNVNVSPELHQFFLASHVPAPLFQISFDNFDMIRPEIESFVDSYLYKNNELVAEYQQSHLDSIRQFRKTLLHGVLQKG